MIDRIVLGHNQFFGVNHLDAQAGDKKAAAFSDASRIMEVIEFSFQQGATGLMMSTHERAVGVAEALRRHPALNRELGVYLLVPYIAKYVKQANEKGIVNIVTDSLKGSSIQNKLSIFLKGGVGLVTRDVEKMITLLIDFEVAAYTRLNLKAIFLHDVMTDLVLGWDMPHVLEIFYHYVEDKYKVIPAFCTKNLPVLMKALEKTDISNPLVMASVNKAGYQVNPSLPDFETCLRKKKLCLLAMSTLAAGYLRPQEAYQYLYGLPNIESVVVGVSNREHARETFSIIKSHIR
jgi:hypothetical protein